MKTHSQITMLVAAVLLAGASANAADIAQDANLAALRAQADKGDAEAQNSLGFVYQAAKDRPEAIKWYTLSAKQGYGAAQNNLCSLHGSSLEVSKGVRPEKGQQLGPIEALQGTKQDVDGVIKWCRAAAERDFARSQRLLGYFYAKGVKASDGREAVKPDYEEAYLWLWRARTGNDPVLDAIAPKFDLAALRAKAQQGDAIAQESLGFIYENGLLGVAKNWMEARSWYTHAAAQGNGGAQNSLCSSHALSLGVLTDAIPPQGRPLGPIESLTGDRDDADGIVKWCRKAGEQGFEPAQQHLGVFYAKGFKADGAEGVKPDYAEAYYWLIKGGVYEDLRDAVGQKLKPAQRAAMEKKAKN